MFVKVTSLVFGQLVRKPVGHGMRPRRTPRFNEGLLALQNHRNICSSTIGNEIERFEDWNTAWFQLMKRLYERGYFLEEDGVSSVNLPLIVEEEPAVVKRALLNFARNEDLLARGCLDRDKLKNLVSSGLPQDTRERKVKNAFRRLRASILEGEDLPVGDGGGATFRDVCRMWLAVAYAKEEAGELSEASLEILPDVIKQIDSTKPPAREQIESKLNQRNSRGMAKNFDKFQSRPPSPKPRSQKVGDRKRAKPWENAPWNQ